jgi:hypothetical protein
LHKPSACAWNTSSPISLPCLCDFFPEGPPKQPHPSDNHLSWPLASFFAEHLLPYHIFLLFLSFPSCHLIP